MQYLRLAQCLGLLCTAVVLKSCRYFLLVIRYPKDLGKETANATFISFTRAGYLIASTYSKFCFGEYGEEKKRRLF